MMKAIFSLLLTIGLVLQLYANPPKSDTLSHSQILVKTDILFFPGFMVEYKSKSTISIQISCYYLLNPMGYQDEDLQLKGSYEAIAETRHYINNHFIGAYLKYSHLEDNVSIYAPFKQVYFSFGPMYGYQKEWGRFNLEGLVGFGISKNIQYEGWTKIGLYYFNEDDPYSAFIDLRLSIGIGFRIF